MGNYGEFEEIKDVNQPPVNTDEQTPARVRMPRNGEIIGVIIQRYGGNRMEVLCTDGKKRNCRVPGRYKRDLWLRPRDIILIVPWPDDNQKGEIVFKYNGSAISQLRKKGIIDSLKEAF